MGAQDHLQKLEDIELVALYKDSGDKMALGVLYKRYTRFVFSVCMKYLKDEDKSRDVVMDIFEQLFEKLLKHQVSNFKSWLYSVAKNQCLHEIRDNRHVLRDEWHEKNSGEDFMENNPFLYPSHELVLNDQIQKLERGITELSEEQRICIELFYLHDHSYEDIAASTGYDLKKVKSYIQNGKRNLKIFLLKKNE